MARKLLFLAIVLGALLSSSPGFTLTIPSNLWVQQPPPTQDLPPDRLGVYAGRGWNHMRYASGLGKMVLFDGYAELPVYSFDSIFANALWLYDPVENRLSLEKVDNWTTQNGFCEPLPENESDPTPWDRHFYSCFVYSPARNAVYLWAGANRTIPDDMIGETWTYDFATHAWREITGPHPYTVYEQACAYDSDLDRMILFAGTDHEYGTGDKTYAFDLSTETWTDRAPASSPMPRMGQNMVYDPVRRVTWMFAGAPWASADSELWCYDDTANTWSQVPKQDPWPSARRFAHFARDSRHDVILMWGGITAKDVTLSDTWIFRPATQTWEQLFPEEFPANPPRFYSVDLDYDEGNDFFVLNLGGTFWLFRYSGSVAGADSDGDASAAPSLRITSSNPAPRGATLAISLPASERVEVGIFNASGHRIETLASGIWDRGPHTVQWSGRPGGVPAASGVYFARLAAAGRVLTKKFTLLR